MIEELLFVAEKKRSECEEFIEDVHSQMKMLVDEYLTDLFSINNEIKETGMYAGNETSIGTICPYVKRQKAEGFSLVYLEYRKYTKAKAGGSSVISRRFKTTAARHKTAIATENFYAKDSMASWTEGRAWEMEMLWEFEKKARGLRGLFSTYYKARKELLRIEQQLKNLIEEEN